MTSDKANIIVQDWAKHLQYSGMINLIFLGEIPESFLPYPKITLNEAINVMIKYYTEIKNEQAVKAIWETQAMLDSYINDEEAIKKAGEKFNNAKWRKRITFSIKNYQSEWLTTQ